MKDLLTLYAGYNIWANNLVIDALNMLPPQKLEQAMNSSFPTILATVTHIWSAEDIWLQRLNNVPNPIWAEINFSGDFIAACLNWQVASRGLEQFTLAQTDGTLKTNAHYTDRAGHRYTLPVCELLIHVFNHSTYHRGQLITLLREAGATKVPGTDFLLYARDKRADIPAA